MTKAKTATTPATDPLDSFVKMANTYPMLAIQLLLWKDRHRNPELTVTVEQTDIDALNQCCEYLRVEPEVRIYRPQGLPAQQGSPAAGNRRATPPRAAQPPKPFVVVQLVDKDGNAIVPVENNLKDQQLGQKHQAIRRLKETAPGLAGQLLGQVAKGEYSNATIQEAAAALTALAQA